MQFKLCQIQVESKKACPLSPSSTPHAHVSYEELNTSHFGQQLHSWSNPKSASFGILNAAWNF
eukprot:8833736-Karenia_brevis.AAC.1